MEIFRGSGVAIVTPFGADGKVDFEAYGRLLEYQLANGTDAVVSCGTTGEASTMTDDEQIAAVRFAVETVNKRAPVIAGAGSNDTEHGVSLAKACAKAGADALLTVTPYYNKTTQRGLVAHFTAQARAVDIPLILYSVASRTGMQILPKTACELSKVPNIMGIKEASKDLSQITEIAELCGDDLTIYSGDDNIVVPILSVGGKGVISVVANVAPRDVHEMVTKYLAGDGAGSLKLQLALQPLCRALFCEVNPIPVKTALRMMGFNAGGFRAPLLEMEEGNRVILERAMREYGLI